jgi:hypothetical protein
MSSFFSVKKPFVAILMLFPALTGISITAKSFSSTNLKAKPEFSNEELLELKTAGLNRVENKILSTNSEKILKIRDSITDGKFMEAFREI